MIGGNLIRVEGVQDLLKRFAKLDKSVAKKYIGAAVTATVKPHIPEVKAFTPKGPTGNLRRSVGSKTEKKRRKNSASATAILGYRSGGSTRGHLGYHAWWIDRGTADRYPKNRSMLAIPADWAYKSKSLRNLVRKIPGEKAYEVIDTGKSHLFFPSVAGIRGTGKFRAWADANLPGLRRSLVANLRRSVEKAAAEQARRDALRAQGRSTS